MTIHKYYWCLFLVTVVVFIACNKDNTYRNENPSGDLYPYNVYEYLERQTTGFDSLLFIINKAGLKDTLATQDVTVFVPSDASIQKALTNYNDRRRGQGLSSVSLKDIDSSALRQIITHYIIRGKWLTDDVAINRDGLFLRTVGDRTMNVVQQTTNAGGVEKAGSQILKFSFMYSSKWTENWSSSLATTTNIKLTNGVVHILEPAHIFSFGNFHNRAAAAQNYWSDYYYYSYGTLYFPDGTSRPWGPQATANMRDGKRLTAISSNELIMDGGDFIGDPVFKIKIAIDNRDSVTSISPATAASDLTIQKHGPSYFDREKFTLYLDYQYDRPAGAPAGLRIIKEEMKLSKN
ncbi:fasciclin domain-containing protein [Niabella ginsengisoli]|uniref:Fasciclin domain-containing protein n=1 Tax=Niabella ginsengisoli TaxID=522298 RepID=A0ABS9SJB4_9BACT|nr:fasciclin domain-containing protein [Niabella ginsengisoli]MCH5598279.1 fasciclin domain-containing protein [Niabella ginsengisoli]